MNGTAAPAPWEAQHRPRRGFEPTFHAMEVLFRPPVRLWFNWRFEGLENIPFAHGPVLIASNHVSYADPLALAYPLYLRGYWAHYLAKSELFKNPLLGSFLRAAGQIPVERGTGNQKPLDDATKLLDAGDAVILFPEGTISRSNEHTQGPSKTGIARLALSTGLAVTPMAVWGTHGFMSTGRGKNPGFGRPIWFSVGEPMSFEGSPEDGTLLREVTDEIMARVAELTDGLRAGYPERWA